MNKKGFTLIEIIAAIFIFSLVALFAATAISFASNNFNRLKVRSELREEAWIALDFLTTQIKLANGYDISYRSGNTLRQLDLYTSLTEGAPEHNYIFRYDRGKSKLDFGGINDYAPGGVNQLSSNISSLSIIIDDKTEIMHISVTAEDGKESLTLNTSVSLRYKELRQ